MSSPKSPDLASLAQTLTTHLTGGVMATVAITGHSGSGKSLLLAGLAQRLVAAGVTVICCDLLRQRPSILRCARSTAALAQASTSARRSRVLWRASGAAAGATLLCDVPLAPSESPAGPVPVGPSPSDDRLDLAGTAGASDFSGPALAWLSCLAKVGLADARVLLTPVSKLSTGQRARYRLACALLLAQVHQERHPGVPVAVVIDELASGLDAVTGASLGPSLLRWQAERSGDLSGPALRRLLIVAGTVEVPGVDLRIELGAGPGLDGPRAASSGQHRSTT